MAALNVRLCVVVICFLVASLKAAPMDKEADFVDEQGKALKYLKVVPGTKRDDIELGQAEKEAGKAVLKLLDAKIGSKVKQAASEVTDFLNGAIGKHAQARTAKLQSDKEKEISLLHIGTEEVLKQNLKQAKKKKGDSFLIHFKVPYVVTPVKKKPGKKYHGHHHHYHHHHHPNPHHDKHNTNKFHPYKPPPNPPAHRPVVHPGAPSPYGQQQPQQQGVAAAQRPSYNAINLNYNGNAWTYSLGNETAAANAGAVPCQGTCMEGCTDQCSLDKGCCCCPDANPASVVAPAPQYLQFPAAAAASPLASCPPACENNCFSYCPQSCCGRMGKRTEVAGEEGSASEAADNEEPAESEESAAVDQEEEQTKGDKTGDEDSGDSETVNDSESNKETEESTEEI